VTTIAIKAIDLIDRLSLLIPVDAVHPLVETFPTDQTDIDILDSCELKDFRTSDSLMSRVNP
jgi:hypothetical protein